MSPDKRHRKNWAPLRIAMVIQGLLVTSCLQTHHEGPVQSRNCTACHGDPRRTGDDVRKAAPPFDLNGDTDPKFRGVGAHQNHLMPSDSHDAVDCTECHVVPETVFGNGHFDSAHGAQIAFGERAKSKDSNPTYDSTKATCSNTYCHQSLTPSNNPEWQAPKDSTKACDTCHGLPPPAPHPQNENCSRCHGNEIDADRHFINRSLHINGEVNTGDLACNSCHGTDVNGGPPPDFEGNTTSDSPGVGAHQNHLMESATHDAVACSSCHAVPEKVDGPGHIDDTRPADVTFSGLADAGTSNPVYDFTTHQCSGTYCHGSYQPSWTAPRDSAEACGSCHESPPPAPHPQNKTCSRCHARVIDANGNFVDKSLHVNGAVDKGSDCNSCHGTDINGGPPPDLEGNITPDHAGVGAHQNHLQASATHDAVPCNSCHVVPADMDGHAPLDAGLPATITFGGLATNHSRTPAYDASKHQCSGSYCHMGYQPTWTAPRDSTAACGSCHGLPPPAPHPQNADCSRCHAQVIDANRNLVNKSLHINGVVNTGTACNVCHGTDATGGPPPDLEGNTTSDHAGVGAHQNHLKASSTHSPVACNSCHVVPSDVNSPGHLDSPLPAEITFGGLSTNNNSAPSYDASTHRCSGAYCHMSFQPAWTVPRDSTAACGSCHGLPPPAPHPQKADCSICHSQVIDSDRQFVNVALHVDGTVQVTPSCNSCHGTTSDGAPPTDLNGNMEPSFPGVGAHQRHLQPAATHGPVACNQCHIVPSAWNTPGHFDGIPPAMITFGSLAMLNNSAASFSATNSTCANVYCHLDASPNWIAQRSDSATCGTCHALPPPFVAGVAISAQSHPKATDCSRCHGAVIDQNKDFTAPEKHVNGTIDVVTLSCNSCHGGSISPAPPTDLSGNTDVSALGVGAHQAHLNGGPDFRPVPCGECHVVPTNVNDPKHINDWTSAVVTFSGAAITNNRTPTWNRQAANCMNVWCHGADTLGAVSPTWTDASVTVTCTSCHGFPPPEPHVQLTTCYFCHSNIKSDNTFVDRTLHVNGSVDF